MSDQNPEGFPDLDRDLEADGDDGAEQHHADILLEDLPEELASEVAEQVAQIEAEAAKNPGKVGH